MITLNLFSQIWAQWQAWRDATFQFVEPLPAQPEIPGREALFAQLEEQRKSHTRDSAMRQAEIASLTESLSEAQERAWLVQKDLTELHQKDWLANLQADSEAGLLMAAILEKAPTSIGHFIEELDAELIRLRQTQPTIVPSGSDRNYAMTKKTMRFRTDGASIRRRVIAAQAARSRAISLATANMSVQAIVDEISQLRKSLPDIVDEETRGPVAAMVLGH